MCHMEETESQVRFFSRCHGCNRRLGHGYLLPGSEKRWWFKDIFCIASSAGISSGAISKAPPAV